MSHTPDAKTTIRDTQDGPSVDSLRKEFDRRRKQKDTEKFPTFPAPRGWECPKCGRVNAPFVSQCPCVAYPNWVPWPAPVNPAPWQPSILIPTAPPWPHYYPKITCGATVQPPMFDVMVFQSGG